jgi:hypothetical protein
MTALFNGQAVNANDLPFAVSGDFKTRIIYKNEIEEFLDEEILMIQLEKDYNFTGGIYFDIQLKSYSEFNGMSKNRETELSLEEGYLDYYTKNIDWRVGKEIIDWGSSYNIKPSNYFNPIDFSAVNPLESREGINLIKAKYYLKNNKEISSILALRDEIDKIQQGFKFTKRRWNGFDISATYFNGNLLQPLLHSQFKTTPVYPEAKKYGLDITGDITEQKIGVFSEAVYSNYQNKNLNDGIEFVGGLNYKFNNNLYLLGQYYFQKAPLNSMENRKIISIHADKPFRQFHSWEINLLYDLNTDLTVFRPKMIFSLAEALELEAGAVIKINENEKSQLNQINEELIYLGVNSYF